MLHPDTPIGTLAANDARAISVFEHYGIDYCCGGHRRLGEVLHERGIPLEKLESELSSVMPSTAENGSAGRDWNVASLTELSDFITKKHHEFLRRELPFIENLMAKVIEHHGARHASSLLPLRRVFRHFKQELEAHLRKEESVLFPALRNLEEARGGENRARPDFGKFSNPIRMMLLEHESAGWELEEMRQLTTYYTPPADACESYRELYRRLRALETDMHMHMHLEDNILFPRTVKLEQESGGG
jgi:regulator of cell morphogenesis and NO signaling